MRQEYFERGNIQQQYPTDRHMSIKQRSKNLTSISLESFISDITAQCENHNFSELLEHPNIHTLKTQHQQMINLFAFGTYQEYIQKKYDVPQLNEKQVETLRRLSILTALKGIQTITLAKLRQIIGMNASEVVDLLLAMNISRQINTRIDEQKGTVLILGAEIRSQKEGQNKSVLRGKISRILQKNNQISEHISSIQKLI